MFTFSVFFRLDHYFCVDTAEVIFFSFATTHLCACSWSPFSYIIIQQVGSRLCQTTSFRSPAAARLCLCFLQLNCHFSKLLSRHERQKICMDLQKKLGKSWSLKIKDLEVTFITVRWFRCPQSWSKSFLSKSPRECKWIAIGAEKSRCSGEWKPGRQRASV